MGALRDFIFGKKKAAAPFQVTSAISPQENYAGYTALPNLPMGSAGDFTPDSYRLHASFQEERERDRLITLAGVHMFDGGDESIIHVNEETLQSYFDQKKEVDPQVILVPAHGVIVPKHMRQHGWSQVYVEPTEPVRMEMSAASPAPLLSTPLKSYSKDSTNGRRSPISAGKAPKAKRGV